MRFYTKHHHTYCGIDLHARTRDVCLLHQAGDLLVHQNMQTSPDALLRSCCPPSSTPLARPTCPRAGKHGPTQPPVRVALHGSPSLPCRSVWQGTLHALALTRTCSTTWTSTGSAPPTSTRRRPCPCSRRCPGWGPSCAACCCMQCLPALVSHASRMVSPRAAWCKGPSHPPGNGTGPRGPRWAMPL
jgi:hypothetical protein